MTDIKRIKKMKKPQGFYELWLKKVGQGMTHEQAYEALESEYEEFWDEPRYSSFNSFKVSQWKRMQSQCLN